MAVSFPPCGRVFRKGCQIIGVALSLAFFAQVGLAAEQPQLISVIFNSAPASPHRLGADALRDAMIKESGGHFAIDLRGNSLVGAEASLLAATQAGAVNVTVMSASVVSSIVPELSVFDIPFLFRDEAHAKAVANGPLSAKLAEKFREKGLVLLALGKQGFRNMTNSKHPIRTPADLAGLKIRVIPNDIYQMTFKALGAEVIPMEFQLVYPALKDGRIDGQENPVANIYGSRLYEVQKYMSMTGHFFASIAFVANRDFFDSLDPSEQAELKAAARAGAEATWLAGAADAKSLDEIRNSGVEVLDSVDRQAFVDALKSLEPEFEKRFGKDTLAAIRSTR